VAASLQYGPPLRFSEMTFWINNSQCLWLMEADNSLEVESLLELLDEERLRKDTALPSPEWSSDHIALLAEFRCKIHLCHFNSWRFLYSYERYFIIPFVPVNEYVPEVVYLISCWNAL
jgi:hypothetical protein